MIKIVNVENREQGNLKAHDIIRTIVDANTLLALSGGTAPDYRVMIADPDDVIPGAICVVDERYGEPFHQNSNEFLMKNMGICNFAESHAIEFVKALTDADFQKAASDYNLKIANLFQKFAKKVGIMGVGANSHTAGIFPNSKAVDSTDLVIGEIVDDKFPQRITLTLHALSKFTNFIILMFGEEKRDVILKMQNESENDIKNYPAVFYRKAQAKCYLITDQDL